MPTNPIKEHRVYLRYVAGEGNAFAAVRLTGQDERPMKAMVAVLGTGE